VIAPETITLGGDLEVRRLGFGAMRVTGEGIWGGPADPGEARAVLREALAAGVNFIDTADSYGPAVSEELIAESLRPYPEDLVIATKGGFRRPGPGHWEPDCHPRRLRRCCEESLLRLKLERIDLYQLHTVDPKVPIEDSVAALAELQQEDKIRHIGLSNVDGEELERAQEITQVVSVQNRFNLVDRSSAEVLRACQEHGLAFLPWKPLAFDGRENTVEQIAASHQATASQVALAWLLAHSPVMLPIPGTSSLKHLDENLAAAELELSDEERDALD
jgi:aryl-alcohol dehydrogenase-like predicted oxidoreductase